MAAAMSTSTTSGSTDQDAAGTLGVSSNGETSSTAVGSESRVPNSPITTQTPSGAQASAVHRGSKPNRATAIAVSTQTAGT